MKSSKKGEAKPDRSIDLTGVLCPMNFVQTKMEIEDMEAGQVLEVILEDGAPIKNVPKSIKEEGHKIVYVGKTDDGKYRLLVEVEGGAK